MKTRFLSAILIAFAVLPVFIGCTQPEDEKEETNVKLKGALRGFSGLYNSANTALNAAPLEGLTINGTFTPGTSTGEASFDSVPTGDQEVDPTLDGNIAWNNWLYTYTSFTDSRYTISGIFNNTQTASESSVTTDIDIVASVSMVDRTLDINAVIDRDSGEVTGGTITFDGKEYDAVDYAEYLQLETY